MAGEVGFWILIAGAVGLIVLLSMVAAAFARGPDWDRREDRPMLGPDDEGTSS